MPLSRPDRSAFQKFFKSQAAAGALLIGCAVIALAAANSPWADDYHRLWETRISIGAGTAALSLTAHQWINDGLMAIFFLLVGLEIKREGLTGELSSPRQAALPIAAAIGGMLVPAVLYTSFAGGGDAARGWAISMATDIAFALGALSLMAPRAPAGLKIFLAALAIVDDIGAVLVIALFYTVQLNWHAMQMAGLCLAALIVLGRFRVRALGPYLALGAVLWFYVHESGIHATVAGVLLAFTIPVRSRLNAAQYSREARAHLAEFDRTETGGLEVITSKGQQDAIFSLGAASRAVLSPLLRLEHALHGLSAFAVMPLFAFSNAGVTMSGLGVDSVTLAVIVGLAIGKPLGITAAAWLAVRSKLAALPEGVTWLSLHGCAWFGGIGFTMALFIANLAFEGTPRLDSAKVGILAASALAGIIGGVIVRLSRTPDASIAPAP